MLNRKAKRRMNEHPLIKILNKHPEYTRLVDALKKGEGSAAVFGLGEAVRPHIAAGLFRHTGKTVLIITANESSAARIQQDWPRLRTGRITCPRGSCRWAQRAFPRPRGLRQGGLSRCARCLTGKTLPLRYRQRR